MNAPVIFRGRVIDFDDDGSHRADNARLYRVRIVEAYKGVPSGLKEIFIEMIGSMCDATLDTEHDHLLYASLTSVHESVAQVVQRLRQYQPMRQMPEAWNRVGYAPTYSIGSFCGPSRTVKDDDPDLVFLRSFSKLPAGAKGWIEGRAAQNYSWPSLIGEFVPASDVAITVKSSMGEVFEAKTASDGAFRVGPISPGAFSISVHSSVFGEGNLGRPQLDLPAGGCSIINASFATNSTISGKVIDADGRLATNIRLELGEVQEKGDIHVLPGTWANTNAQGEFKVRNVPLARIVLAANLKGAPEPRMPFDSFYVPGTQEISRARIFTVRPGENINIGTLRLPPQVAFGDLFVDVTWPDGTAATGGARATAEWNKARADFEWAPASGNRVKLRLALGRTYLVEVDWFHHESNKVTYVGHSESKRVAFFHDGEIIQVALKESRPH